MGANICYGNNDQQVIANPIHLLLNVRRSSVRLHQTEHPKDDSKMIHRLKFTYDSMCTCSLKLDIYANIHNLNSSNLNSREPAKKLYRAQKLKGEINLKFVEESPILDMQEIMNTIRRQNINVTHDQKTSVSGFYIVILLYRVTPEGRSDPGYQEQITYVQIEQMNEGLSKTDNWNIVSVRQVCSVGKIQFLLQDIYGIENKKQLNKEKLGYEKNANNPTGGGEDEDTNCVVCLSEP